MRCTWAEKDFSPYTIIIKETAVKPWQKFTDYHKLIYKGDLTWPVTIKNTYPCNLFRWISILFWNFNWEPTMLLAKTLFAPTIKTSCSKTYSNENKMFALYVSQVESLHFGWKKLRIIWHIKNKQTKKKTTGHVL